MSGRERALTSGYLFSYMALAAMAQARYSLAKVSRIVDDRAANGTGGERLGLDGLEALVLLAEVTHDSDDVEVVFLLQPFDAHGGVEATGVGEHAPLFLAGGRLGGDLRGVVKG